MVKYSKMDMHLANTNLSYVDHELQMGSNKLFDIPHISLSKTFDDEDKQFQFHPQFHPQFQIVNEPFFHCHQIHQSSSKMQLKSRWFCDTPHQNFFGLSMNQLLSCVSIKSAR